MAIDATRNKTIETPITWQEESGLLRFLSTINAEVRRFDRTFGLGVELLPMQPAAIDGSEALLKQLGFVVVRRNSALMSRDYCLYTVLQGKALQCYIGIYSDGSITTVKELGAITEYKKAQDGMLGWLRDLLRASFEKI